MTICDLPAAVCDRVIDVSHHNAAIDWPAVAGAGIALAFVKATQGTRFVDPKFRRNRCEAGRAGVLTVPYHFLDTSNPEAQARHFLATADLGAGQPVMLDWETDAPAPAVAAFGTAVAERTGRDPVACYGYAQLTRPEPALSAWPLMLPAYPRGSRSGDYHTLVARPPRLPPGRAVAWIGGGRPYDFHQYTPAGRVPGIAGPVDRSIWVGTRPALAAWYATGAVPAAAIDVIA
jgi:lysozyme